MWISSNPWLVRTVPAIALFVVLAMPAGGQLSLTVITARLHGWGHSCSGDLVLTPRTISWMTPWNSCRATAFKIIEQQDQGKDIDRIYRLEHLSKGCIYRFIKIEYSQEAVDNKTGLAWYAEGYPTLADAKNQDESRALGCQLEQKYARFSVSQ